MKPFDPGLLFVERFLITNSISLLVISLFRFFFFLYDYVLISYMFLGMYSLLLGHHCDRDLKPLEGSTYLRGKNHVELHSDSGSPYSSSRRIKYIIESVFFFPPQS